MAVGRATRPHQSATVILKHYRGIEHLYTQHRVQGHNKHLRNARAKNYLP